eukprot:4584482-Prymnesium_polylepis.1
MELDIEGFRELLHAISPDAEAKLERTITKGREPHCRAASRGSRAARRATPQAATAEQRQIMCRRYAVTPSLHARRIRDRTSTNLTCACVPRSSPESYTHPHAPWSSAAPDAVLLASVLFVTIVLGATLVFGATRRSE